MLKFIKLMISIKEYDMFVKYVGYLNVDFNEFDDYMSENYDG